jgi:D-tyrosyl-tRNA(Tyr) deacylase
MNLSVKDIDGEIITVSATPMPSKGNRPSYIKAAKPDVAIPCMKTLCKSGKRIERKIQTGVFLSDMKVSLLNDGPVTIIIDSKNKE